jgi:hypothetical protein
LQVTDSRTFNGPIQSADPEEGTQIPLVGPKDSKPYPLPKCGANTLKFRTEIKIAASEDDKQGYVASEVVTGKDGQKHYYGTQLGFSYDWQKCDKD